MSILTSNKCLVLNKNWTPVNTVTLEDALKKIFSIYEDGTPKARIIDAQSFQTFTWADWSKLRPTATENKITGATHHFKMPEIILLSRYEKIPNPKVNFSRRTLYKRDKITCQYCGRKPGGEELTVEHIVPRCQGGKTTWTNTCLACTTCNVRKAGRTPEQAGMKLLSVPKKPVNKLFNFDISKPIKSWEAFLGECFWTVELENDNQD